MDDCFTPEKGTIKTPASAAIGAALVLMNGRKTVGALFYFMASGASDIIKAQWNCGRIL